MTPRRFSLWKANPVGCTRAPRFECVASYPTQLTNDEIAKVINVFRDQIKASWSAFAIAATLVRERIVITSIPNILSYARDLSLHKRKIKLMGPSGLGKTHLMLALAHKACMTGSTVWYTSCIDLIEDLSRAREQGRLKRRLTWLRKPHVVLIDEVGYEGLTKEQANLFFQVVNTRYEHGSMILTTNKSFGQWAEVLSGKCNDPGSARELTHLNPSRL
jgi:DNA replication protein DnaC